MFSPLPYATCGHIGYMNEHNFFNYHNVDRMETMYSRPYPRGSLGVRLEKTLHDDKNGFLALGLWQCVAADPLNDIAFCFNTVRKKWHFISSTGRFALFNGLVPHESKLIREHVKSPTRRVHHSSYWKTDHEYISLVLMSPANVKDLHVTRLPDG